MKVVVIGNLLFFLVSFLPIPTDVYVAVDRYIHAEVTAYNSDPRQTDETPLLMANGGKVHAGAVACPETLKFGSRVEIQGKVYVCEDRMNERYRKANFFDVWVPSEHEARVWGRQQLAIRVLQ